ncbi:terpenoid synthase [Ceraceosorus guamensis]|uniref:(2E,6E)-farnesyl diphosphate synthase n=1 Tax=Ceraceosorus guamensis TaxID=1522189 RepID=A0A316VVP6_9BASI|nr:terpenoid synthase [Ceraceosorus guamensis]PWN41018.1 terpenoid synthase [Ceraceosorus guamensis]
MPFSDSLDQSQSSQEASKSSALPSDPRPSTSAPTLAPSAFNAFYTNIRSHLSLDPTWSAVQERVLLEPFSYLASNPGKEIRGKLIDAFNCWLRLPEEKLGIVKDVVGRLHTASLLMDDVEDNSDLRRGIPVAHKIYGVPQTINTANYVYFQAFSLIFSMGTPSSSRVSVERLVNDELMNLHRGQGLDLFWRDALICPTEEEYVDMVNNKTGGLLRIAAKLMMAHSGLYADSESATNAQHSAPDLLPLVNLIGLLFQIRDDYMNLQSAAYASNKGFAEDLTEGKFSFPLIHGIRASASDLDQSQERTHAPPSTPAHLPRPGISPVNSASNVRKTSPPSRPSTLSSPETVPPNRRLLSILAQRPSDEATKRYAVHYLKDVTRSFHYTIGIMHHLDGVVGEEIDKVEAVLGQNPALRSICLALRAGWWGADGGDEKWASGAS